MNDDVRRALRERARRATWGPGGPLAVATLRRVARELDALLEQHPDLAEIWAGRAVRELTDHCHRARTGWGKASVSTLDRLRDTAVTALAPGPGQDPDPQASSGPRVHADRAATALRSLRPPAGRGRWLVPLAGCTALLAVALGGTALLGHGATPGATAPPSAAPAGLGTAAPAQGPSELGTPGATEGSPADSPSPARTSRVTTIEPTWSVAEDYPEIQIFGSITTDGAGDVTVTITVTGAHGSPQVLTVDESGRTTYALAQTIYLQQWCGHDGTVTVTVASGPLSRSTSARVTGC